MITVIKRIENVVKEKKKQRNELSRKLTIIFFLPKNIKNVLPYEKRLKPKIVARGMWRGQVSVHFNG